MENYMKDKSQFYTLPELSYSYDALEPVISRELLALHHDMHHKSYVDNANQILEKLDESRKDGTDLEFGAKYKALSFNVGGHVLHSLFWENMCPVDDTTGPSEELKKALEDEFGSIERFILEFSNTALKVEGSGWAALTYCRKTKRPIIMQIEKHNVNIYPMFSILLVMDLWEHAYYVDYLNKRGEFIDKFWDIANWKEVSRRYEEASK